LEELSQRLAAEAEAAPGRDARLLQQAQDAAAAQVKQQVADAKAELLRDLEGWGEKVQAAAGEAAAERVKAGAEVRSSDGNVMTLITEAHCMHVMDVQVHQGFPSSSCHLYF
jgi:predicted nucleic acid-binding Zn ribbon protein